MDNLINKTEDLFDPNVGLFRSDLIKHLLDILFNS